MLPLADADCLSALPINKRRFILSDIFIDMEGGFRRRIKTAFYATEQHIFFSIGFTNQNKRNAWLRDNSPQRDHIVNKSMLQKNPLW